VRADVERQRPELAGIETTDAGAHQAVEQSFVSAYRAILWVANGAGHRQFPKRRDMDIEGDGLVDEVCLIAM
jgi:hypothetical protein